MPKIIAFCGFAGSGKDTAADFLVENYNFKKDAFAKPLKEVVSAVFGWSIYMLSGTTEKSREWREEVDEWWADKLNMPGLTPRKVLQLWGTEVCRENFNNDIWVHSFEKRMLDSKYDVAVTDARFPNEINAVHRVGGTVCLIKRGKDPKWFETAKLANSGSIKHQEELKTLGIHASETSWIGSPVDAVIHNDGTIEELHEQLRTLLNL